MEAASAEAGSAERSSRWPRLDFGTPFMNENDLKTALSEQLRLHCSFDVGEGLTRVRKLDGPSFARYLDQRLAAASWFLYVLSKDELGAPDHHSVLLPALTVMDRYAVACETEGRLRDALTNAANVRAACVSILMKMYSAYAWVPSKEMSARSREWPNSTRDRVLDGEGPSPDEIAHEVSTSAGVVAAEKDILVTLKGAAFPVHEGNTVSALMSYLSLGRREPVDEGLLERAAARATDTLWNVALDAEVVSIVPAWKRAAVCSLLEFQDASNASPEERRLDERRLVALYEKLLPGHLTFDDVGELATLFAVDCPVCMRPHLDSRARQSLLKISSRTCSSCEKLLPLAIKSRRRGFRERMSQLWQRTKQHCLLRPRVKKEEEEEEEEEEDEDKEEDDEEEEDDDDTPLSLYCHESDPL